MSYMKHLIFILFLLMLMTSLTYSQTPINVSGSEGLRLLNSLTQSILNQTNDSLNATNNTINLNGIKGTSSSDFWSWGTKPKNYSGYYDNSADDYLSDPTTDVSNDI